MGSKKPHKKTTWTAAEDEVFSKRFGKFIRTGTNPDGDYIKAIIASDLRTRTVAMIRSRLQYKQKCAKQKKSDMTMK